MSADRHLLFGLLALVNGFIRPDQLVAAFHAWTTDKSRPLADHLVALGHLDDARRAAIEALAALHVETHGGDPEQSLATLSVSTMTLDRLREIGDPVMSASLAGVGRRSTQPDGDNDRTATFTFGTATADGQRFRILRPHAHGGLGAVFVALDSELNREVALKQILDKRADDPTSRRRFLLEAEITGRLEHPGIVPVYGLGTDGDGRPYYVMRFIRGDTLKEAIDRCHADEAIKKDAGRRSLELRKLLRRFTDVCNAIEYAHSRGVLHRDIKPGNIVIGEHGETLVVDWGLAKPLGRAGPGSQPGERMLIPSSAGASAETLPGEAMGTPAYMSPEQAEGNLEALGPRSDVYSLGATLYYLLTGKPPLEGDDLGALLRAVQKGAIPRPRRVEPSIDRALEAVCLKAMALKPDDRYATPRALAEDVERWLADQPVLAYAEPLWTRASRLVRRHRPWVAAAGVLLILIAAGLAIYSRQLLREKNRTTAYNQQILREQGRTTDQLAMTRDALRELLRVSGENLALVPNTEGLRESLAQLVLDRYQRLGERFPTDLGVRLETAQVLRVIGGIGRITRKNFEVAGVLWSGNRDPDLALRGGTDPDGLSWVDDGNLCRSGRAQPHERPDARGGGGFPGRDRPGGQARSPPAPSRSPAGEGLGPDQPLGSSHARESTRERPRNRRWGRDPAEAPRRDGLAVRPHDQGPMAPRPGPDRPRRRLQGNGPARPRPPGFRRGGAGREPGPSRGRNV